MTPDSIRLALPAEADAIAALQRRHWSTTLPTELADAFLGAVDLDAMTTQWELAILRPPLAQYRVLVAVADDRLAGFAALGPCADPDAIPGRDGQVAEFVIDPLLRGRGHGSRLLNASMDTLRTDGFGRATWWVRATDDTLRRFLTGAGWAPDGAHSELGTEDETARVKLVRLHTALPGGAETPSQGTEV